MIRLNDILERVNTYRPEADLDLIKKAYVYSAKVHQGQVRKSGEPYLIHPLEVAGLLAELKLDEASIVAGLLHDTIEDTLATPAEIRELFGDEVLSLVEGVTKLGTFSHGPTTQEEKQAENFRKMLVAMAKDIRVILVKLADRTHNMRTLAHMQPDAQQRIAQETLDIYAPLAHRLGIQWIKIELEDLAFRYLKQAEYADHEQQVAQTQKDRAKFIGDVVQLLQTKLKEAGLEAEVQGRPKHLYSIWKKMRKNGLNSVSQLHDIVAFRLILKSVPACYEALGLIHSLWKPVPGRFKDYVAIPKPNMYQSLHTTVIGPTGERIEIQMRTEEMHRIAEEGIAAHWVYKEGKSSGRDEQKFAWLRQLMEWQQDLKDPRQFIKMQQRERSLEIGRDLLEREFRRFDLTFTKMVKAPEFLKLANDYGHSRADDLVSAVGYGKLSPANVLQRLLPPERLAQKKGDGAEADGVEHQSRLSQLFRKVAQRSRTGGGVRIGGIDDVLVRYGRCCSPVPGDQIVGFITRGRGVTVHTRACSKGLETDPERRVEVTWDVHGEFKRAVNLRVRSDDRKGLLAKMSETFADVGVNILQANARSNGDNGAVSTFEIEIVDVKQLNDVVRAIGQIPGVHSVERV